jgi:hypothetical protein
MQRSLAVTSAEQPSIVKCVAGTGISTRA